MAVTTNEVREAWVNSLFTSGVVDEFDEWLASVKADAREQGWNDALDAEQANS